MQQGFGTVMSQASLTPTTRLSADAPEMSGPASSPPADLCLPAIGHVLAGKYRIEHILGRGGMGVVVAGHQLSLDRSVAIKFLRRFATEGSRQRFTREALAVARMKSEHAVRVFDAGEEEGIPFIVMERLVGRDLAAELSVAPLEVETAAAYLLEACAAIAEAHALGMVHRDIKPSNLFLVDRSGGQKVLKVLDFGVSKQLGSVNGLDPGTSTVDACLVGTPAYASPEQLLSPATVDTRIDIWGLGVVLYQCVSGRRPFAARNLAQLGAAILAAPPADFDPALEIPDALRSVIWRCLEKRPEDRFQSVEALASALRALQLRPLGRRRSWMAAGFTGAALVVASVSFFRPSSSSDLTLQRDLVARPARSLPAHSVPRQFSSTASTPAAAESPREHPGLATRRASSDPVTSVTPIATSSTPTPARKSRRAPVASQRLSSATLTQEHAPLTAGASLTAGQSYDGIDPLFGIVVESPGAATRGSLGTSGTGADVDDRAQRPRGGH
jgi:eukaryotic-like serine/threonine-protein kinase